MTAAEEKALCESLRGLLDLVLEFARELDRTGIAPKVPPERFTVIEGGKAS